MHRSLLFIALIAPPGPHPAPAPHLGALHPTLGSSRAIMLQRAPGDSAWRPMARVTISRDTTRLDGDPVVRNVIDYDWGNGRRTLDSMVSRAVTLAPLSERTRTPSRIVSYDFVTGRRVTGRMGPDTAATRFEASLPHPAFNSTDLDMLLTALPLRAHFRVELPLYDPEYPGFRMATVRVEGEAQVATTGGPRRAWVVSVEEPRHPPLSYQIDAVTHDVLEKRFGAPSATRFRIVAEAVQLP